MPRLLALLRRLALERVGAFFVRWICPPANFWFAARISGIEGAPRIPTSPGRSHAHIRRCAAGGDRLPRAGLPSLAPSSTLPHKLRTTTVCAGLCGAQTHTQWALLMAGEAAPQLPHGTRTACSCAAAARGRGFSRDPACPQPHNCMAHPAPHTTRQRRPHTDTRAARTLRGPAPLGPRPCILSHHCPRTDQNTQFRVGSQPPKPHPASSIPASLSALAPVFLYHRSPHAVRTRQGLTLAGKKAAGNPEDGAAGRMGFG